MANQEHLKILKQGVEAWNRWRRKNPEIEPDLHEANLSAANLIGADLSNADLRDANLISTDLSNADFRDTNLSFANLSGADLSSANLKSADLYDASLRNASLFGANLFGANLSLADLSNTNLSNTNLSNTNLSNANLSSANLSSANLHATQALAADFSEATLTGACIEDWNINALTNLKNIACDYIFKGEFKGVTGFTDRRPHDSNQIFAPGEFTKRYQIVLETVDLFFNDGIDWAAFLASLQDLKTEYGDDLNIQGIEKKAGGSFVVRLEVPSDADKGAIERDGKEWYAANLKLVEAQYRTELQELEIQHKDEIIALHRQYGANLYELAKLQASQPIINQAMASADNQSRSNTFNNTFNQSPIGNFANQLNDQSAQHATQNIGASLDEITALIQSMREIAESFPVAQRTEAIEHLEDLETDVQQPPEKRKLSRMKAALLALVGIAAAVSGAVTSTNEFVGQVQELSEKLGIPLPIEQVESQEPIDVKIIGSD